MKMLARRVLLLPDEVRAMANNVHRFATIASDCRGSTSPEWPGVGLSSGAAGRGLGTALARAAVPRQFGGSGADLLAQGSAMYEVGRTLWPSARFATVALGLPILAATSAVSLQEQWLTEVAHNDVSITLAADSANLIAATTVSALWSDGHWRLSGTVERVADGGIADLFIVPAQVGAATSLFVLPRASRGIEVGPVHRLRQSPRLAPVYFDGAIADELPVPQAPSALLSMVRDRALALMHLEFAGGARSAMQLSLSYLRAQPRALDRSYPSVVDRLEQSMLLAVRCCEDLAWKAITDLHEGRLSAKRSGILANILVRSSAADVASAAAELVAESDTGSARWIELFRDRVDGSGALLESREAAVHRARDLAIQLPRPVKGMASQRAWGHDATSRSSMR